MSDNPREAQRKMERVFLCNDIWFDCLPWLSRAKVGFEFALVSDRFDGLADAHLNSKKRPWTLGRLWIKQKQGKAIFVKNPCTENEEHCILEIKREQGDATIFNCDTKKYLPLPKDLLPENVIGFNRINIRYIDHKVIDFLRRIRRLFQPKNNGENDGIGLELAIPFSQVRSWDFFFDSIWPLINPSAITKLDFTGYDSFDAFRRRISPTFLFDLANLRLVHVNSFEDEANGQLFRKWLLTPREDGKPKLLKKYRDWRWDFKVLEQLKMEFLSAQNAVSFFIAFVIDEFVAFVNDDDDNVVYHFVPFELDNWRTGERLTFRNVKNIDDYEYWLLERGPIGGRDTAQWAKWAREAPGHGQKHNFLSFSLYDDNFDEIAGPSGQELRK